MKRVHNPSHWGQEINLVPYYTQVPQTAGGARIPVRVRGVDIQFTNEQNWDDWTIYFQRKQSTNLGTIGRVFMPEVDVVINWARTGGQGVETRHKTRLVGNALHISGGAATVSVEVFYPQLISPQLPTSFTDTLQLAAQPGFPSKWSTHEDIDSIQLAPPPSYPPGQARSQFIIPPFCETLAARLFFPAGGIPIATPTMNVDFMRRDFLTVVQRYSFTFGIAAFDWPQPLPVPQFAEVVRVTPLGGLGGDISVQFNGRT